MNCFDGEKYLAEAIDSIYAQTFDDWEIVFVDNCSTDNSAGIAKNYGSKIKYLKTKENIPLGAARNFGLKFCDGEYVAFLDTDDIWLKDKLMTQIVQMDLDKDMMLCYGGVININKDGKETGRSIPQATTGDVFAQQLKRYEVNMQSVVLRNNSKIYFDEKLYFSPDFELFLNITSTSKVLVIKDYIVKYRKLENSLTSKNIAMWSSEMQYTLDKIFLNKRLREKYQKEHVVAYAKVAYYKARYLISIDKRGEANDELSKHKFVSFQYFVLYVLSFFPRFVWAFAHKHR